MSPGAQVPLPGQGIRVLFVDDSPTARTFISRLLRANGYRIDAAADPAEALRMAASQPFDIAIIDYFMPTYNGDELCRRLKARSETAHMITAISASAYLDKVIKNSLDAGASDCMFKNEADELLVPAWPR
jgi:CheY-like chemotaxis protein